MTKLFLSLWVFFISGGVRTALAASYGPSDVVANNGDNVTFAYLNDMLTTSDYYYWAVYNPKQNIIYQRGDQQTSNPDKFLAFYNGSFCLNVSKVTTQDASTYCFYSAKTKNVSCANLIVIESLVASVSPPSGISVGQTANLTCCLRYGGPTSDEDNIRPLSRDQDPDISMYIGNNEIKDVPPGEETIGSDDDIHSKSISILRNISKEDVGKELKCFLSTSKPSYKRNCSSSMNIRCPTTNAVIDYPHNATGNNSRTWCCRVNDVLNCTADGFPYATVAWKDENGLDVQPLNAGSGYCAVQLKKKGKYAWNCTARNDLSTVPAYDSIYIDTDEVPYGQSASGSLRIHDITSPLVFLWLVILAIASNKVLTA